VTRPIQFQIRERPETLHSRIAPLAPRALPTWGSWRVHELEGHGEIEVLPRRAGLSFETSDTQQFVGVERSPDDLHFVRFKNATRREHHQDGHVASAKQRAGQPASRSQNTSSELHGNDNPRLSSYVELLVSRSNNDDFLRLFTGRGDHLITLSPVARPARNAEIFNVVCSSPRNWENVVYCDLRGFQRKFAILTFRLVSENYEPELTYRDLSSE
jgi:hypothetical protein